MGAPPKLSSAVSEFVGTYCLVFTVGCCVLSPVAAGPLAIAAVLMVAIYSLASVSGAHFNPAVSVSIWQSNSLTTGADLWPGQGAMAVAKVATYLAAQFAGGLLAGLSTSHLFGRSWPALGPATNDNEAGVLLAEGIFTTMLCLVVLRAAVSPANPKDNEAFGLAIGFVILAAGYSVGPISGATLNPAVAVTFAVLGPSSGRWCALYLATQLTAAAVAAGLSKLLESKPEPGLLQPKGRSFLAEALGTFFLVCTVGFNVTTGSPAPALSIGAGLASLVYAFGPTSGAHLNPAVSWAIALAKPQLLCFTDLCLYWLAQVLGGILAAIAVTISVGHALPVQPAAAYLWGHAAIAEAIYTFVLCFVVLNVATLPDDLACGDGGKARHFYGLAIGFAVVGGALAAGPVSGGVLNPAVAIGLDTAFAVHAGGQWINWIAYTLMQLTGASLAAGVFRVVRDDVHLKA